MPRRTPALAAALVVAVVAVLSGCAGSTPSGPRYVALGDSFTSAPGVPEIVSPECGRSDRNYPSLVADALEASEFVDVSCGSANTTDALEGQVTDRGTRVPPQVDAVTRDTDLVTLGLGGNDESLLLVVTEVCVAVADRRGEAPCRDELARRIGDPQARLAAIRDGVATVVAEVQERAPRAAVVVVGYPLLTTAGEQCPDLPIAPGDHALVELIGVGLNLALRSAAEDAGAAFVDPGPASRSHGICSEDPWVNGAQADEDAAAYHPTPAGLRAMARLVEREAATG